MLDAQKLRLIRAALNYFYEEVAIHVGDAMNPYLPSPREGPMPTSSEVLALSQDLEVRVAMQAVYEPGDRTISLLPESSQMWELNGIPCTLLIHKDNLDQFS